MLKQLILAAALALFAVPASAQKANAPATKPSRATMSFVKNALVGSKFAVESSRLAAQKAQNPDVKNFAQRLADDYSRRSEELKQIKGLRSVKTSRTEKQG